MTIPHITRPVCDAALPHILAAPKDSATLSQLCFRPDYAQRQFPKHLDLTVKHGILGERWAKAPWLTLEDGTGDPRIQISILSKRVMDLCWRDRENTPHPGDPFVVDMDLGFENLPVGTRLSVGEAQIEVSDKFNNACVKWQSRYGNESLRWINARENRPHRLRGVLCRIVQDGRVRVGDVLRKL